MKPLLPSTQGSSPQTPGIHHLTCCAATGFGVQVMQDLMSLGPLQASPVAKDVVRWLRIASTYLTRHAE